MGDVIQLHLNTDPAISLDEYRLLTQIQRLRAQKAAAEAATVQAQIHVTAITDAAVAHLLLAWSVTQDTPPTDAEYEAKRTQIRALLRRTATNATRKDQAR